MSVPVIQPASGGLYRNVMGRPGADELMSRDVGSGGRYFITTGEAATVNGGSSALPDDWRRILDWQSPSFAILVLGTILLLLHGHVGGSVSASVRK